ncbi:MAG: hypothetical protein GX173_03445 [Ruminococcaceae bacterium]|nr:hypothetical protein [Oscillospiraceae bacterium]
MNRPVYWKSSLQDIGQAVQSVKKGKASLLCQSAGGRDIYLFEYGKRNVIKHDANYSSATGAKDPKYYADKTGADYTPTVLLVGAVHGGEFEGTVALLNLICLLETGFDLAGRENRELLAATEQINLLLIPCLNVDGRARVPFDAFLGVDYQTFRYYSQGTWLDGSLCEWPQCKAKHPIKEHVQFLGSYFNDHGVNLMHDHFFFPMAEETKALLRLCDERVPDITIHFHGGSNTTSTFLQTSYVPAFLNQRTYDLAQSVKAAAMDRGCDALFAVCPEQANNSAFPPASFNLVSACSHINGEVCIVYESNQGLAMENAFTPEQIYQILQITITETCQYAKKICRQRKKGSGI